jgi:hypothetical protein
MADLHYPLKRLERLATRCGIARSIADAAQLAPKLELIDLRGCGGIVDAASIVLRAAEWSVKLLV